ncbi:purine-binding chemotaxis protein CheW [Pseudomonas monteilii]|jgi:chemotaxis-related protein WspD|uniref:Chemotaxis protein CheW n=2 Tax=Pseudomonas putida group TaxID=136845 RepID=A0AAE6R9N1_9PSED|nr:MULTISPECIES: chemotaxis protein CheW [Pseudomonas]MBB3270572.1 chemotaxis-related protein WspD [Pseudomonas sp. OG7]MBH3457051.1 purine-binding chemotaxis protein CheW [Pseudomonas monteilii]MCJ7851181.1 chemotaxis protein CheW [Pseudomonas monteilii]MDD2122878.1 chemotaxis protein CheW [Pseudomonas monteilii]MDI3368037.1 chemotaxis protein CheW [Pseudomonas sp. V104_10]
MKGDSAMQLLAEDDAHIDDCWNRIGVHGDKQCPLLERHVHCRNCDVYAAAATRLLDRYALMQDHQAAAAQPVEENTGRSMLLFRLGEEWLALATASLAEIAPLQAVHSLPHQRSRVLQGVANVRGALVPCLSLADLLGVQAGTAEQRSGRVMPRMLILAAEGGPVVMAVEEIDGIHRLDPLLLDSGQDATRFTAAVLQWRGRSVRVLDDQHLLSAVQRSLS